MPPDLPDAGDPDAAVSAPAPPPRHPETVKAYNPDGSTIDLAPAEAQAAYQAGKVGFANADRVNVRLSDGRMGSVPGSALADALGGGAKIVSPAEARQHELEAKYGGALGTLEAAGLGALRGGSFGLSDVLGGAIGGDKYNEVADALKEAHPIATGIGEGGGMLALGAATGGSSALEEGAEAIGTRALGEGMAGRLAGHAVSGAVEGAYLGGADAVSEDALSGGDHQLTAEKLFASMGENALYGGLLGAGGAAVGEALGGLRGKVGDLLARAPSPEAVEKVAEAQYGYVPKGLGDALVKAQATMAGGGEDIIREAGVQNQSSGAKALRKTLLNIDDERDSATRQIVEHVNTMLSDGKDLADEARGAVKRSHLAETVTKDNAPAIAEHAASTIASTRTQIQSMLADADTFGQEKLLGRMNKELGRIEDRIRVAGAAGDNAEQFALLDDAKRAIGSWTRDVKSTSLRTSTDPISLRQSRQTYDALDNVYEGLRGNLENEGVWGKAAADQRRINEAWSSQIAADKQFKATLAATIGEERFGGRIYAADPAKVERYVGSIVNPNQDLVHQAITSYVARTRDLVDAIGTSYDLPAAKMAQVARAKAAADAFDKTISGIGDKLAKANQLKALLGQEGGAGGMGATMAGSLLGGPAGAAVGALGTQLASPGRNIMRLAQLEQIMNRVDGAVGKHVDAFFARARSTAKGIARRGMAEGEGLGEALHAEAETARDKIVDVAVGSVKEHAKETVKDSIRERFEDRAEGARELAEKPTMVMDRMAPMARGLEGTAPKTAVAIGAVGAKAAGYLVSQLPHPPPADAMTGKQGVPPASEMARFTSVSDTVLHPQSALEDLAKGRLTKDQVDALQAVYPSFYAQIRSRVQAKLMDHTAKGNAITYGQRVQLATLFGIEGDPTMEAPAVAHAQATFSTPPAKAQHGAKGGGKPLQVASSAQTPAQKIESAGAGAGS